MFQGYQRLIGDYSGNLATCCRGVPGDGQLSDLGLPISNNALRYLRTSALSFSPAEVKLALCVLSMTMIFYGVCYSLSKGNFQEALEDLNHFEEITGTSQFSLIVFLCLYILVPFSNFWVFLVYIDCAYQRT